MAQLEYQFDLVRLNGFRVIAEAGSITAAAQLLGVAQPALSASLRRLEADLGHPLFERQARGVALTKAGKLLLPKVYEVLGILEATQSELADVSKTLDGEVSIGLPPSASNVLLQPLLARLTENFPHLSVRIVEAMSGYLVDWVDHGELDIALSFAPQSTESVSTHALFSEELCLIATPDALKGLPNPYPMRNLDRLPLIMTSVRHKLRSLLEQQVQAMGTSLDIRYEIDAGAQLVKLVAAGAGFGIFAQSAFAEAIAEGKVRAISLDPNYTRTVFICAHRRKAADRIVNTVTKTIEALAHELRNNGVWPS